MKSLRLFAFAAAITSAIAAPAYAIDFKSVGAAPSIMYDAPSQKGRRVYIAPRGMPVEVILTYGEWSKVRDAAGTLSWLMSKSLVAPRNVVVTAANARIHAAADDNSPVVFSADKNVLLELMEAASSGWLHVKHRDGQSGYVKTADVWGD